MKNRILFLTVLVLMSFLALSVQASAAPIFSNNITVNSTAWYMPNSDHSFMVTITNGTDAGNITNVTFQLGIPVGTLTNYTNYTSGIFVKNNTNSVWHINFTQEQFGGAGTYNYTWFANTSFGNEWNKTDTISFDGGAANATNQVSLWFMNSTHNVLNQNMTPSNIIYPAKTNATTYLIFSQSGTANLYLNGVLANSVNNTNITLASGLNRITGNTTGNENYSATSQTFWINITYNTSFPSAFSMNDTYINMNETVLLNVSFPSGASLTAEVQTPKSTQNRTLWYENSFYILKLNKTWLGDLQANISKFINITNIFIGGNYTDNRNATILNFSYATTQMTGVTVSPNPVTNNTGQTAAFSAYFNNTEGNALPNMACNLTLGAYQYVMNYLSGLYSAAVATAGYNDNVYNYNITCANNSYQTQENATEWLQIKYAVGGTSGGGDIISNIMSMIQTNKTPIFIKPAIITIFAQNNKISTCYEKEGDCYFTIYNPNNFTIKARILANSSDVSRQWVSFSDRKLNEIIVNVPSAILFSSGKEDGYLKIPFTVKPEFSEVGNYKSSIIIEYENTTAQLPVNIYISDGSSISSKIKEISVMLENITIIDLPKPFFGKKIITGFDITLFILSVFLIGIVYRAIMFMLVKKR